MQMASDARKVLRWKLVLNFIVVKSLSEKILSKIPAMYY